MQSLHLRMRLNRFRLLSTASCLLLTTFLHAGGFQLNAQGQKQMGMGHCGTGLRTDNASLFFNPGITPFLEHRFAVTAGTNLINHRTLYLEPAPGIYTDTMLNDIGTPFELYADYNFKQINIGVAVYTPFGSKASWPDDWKGANLIQSISLKTIFIQPTFSVKVSDRIGFGIGFIYATGGLELRQGVPVQDTSMQYAKAALKGDASGMGYNVGAYFSINEHFSAGISFRSQVAVQVESGSAAFAVPASLADHFPATTFSSRIVLPSVTNIGLGYSCCKWKAALDMNFVGWHTYDSLIIDFADNTDKLADVHSARMYKDTYIIRGGAEYTIDPSCTIRFGLYYDHTPVQDGYLTPETPDADRIGVTFGTGIKATKKLSFDFSLLYIEAMKRTDTNLETGFGGTYKTRVIAPGFGFTAIL